MKKTISTLAALALAATGALSAGTGAADAGSAAPAKKKTGFAFSASGFGTTVNGGRVPVGSGTSAYQALGCTNSAGKSKRNFVAEEDLGGTARAENVTTRLTTLQRGGETASISRAHVARVVLAESGLGRLQITAVDSVSKAFHKNGFKTSDGDLDRRHHVQADRPACAERAHPDAGPAGHRPGSRDDRDR